MFTNIKFTDSVPKVGDYPENSWVWNDKRKEMFLVLPKKVIAFGKVSTNAFDFCKETVVISEAEMHYLGENPKTILEPSNTLECIAPIQVVVIVDPMEAFDVKKGTKILFKIEDEVLFSRDMPKTLSVLLLNMFEDVFTVPGKPLTLSLTSNPIGGSARMKVHIVYQTIEL